MTTTSSIGNTPSAAQADAAASVSPTNTLAKLTGNFNDFLTLLTTQLKNQDPTAPMDTNQFTSQLVQFTAVAQQIETNKTLGQLLTASQAQQLSQASGLIGQQVTIAGGTLPLQAGRAQVNFQVSGSQPVQVAVTDAAGKLVRFDTVDAADGKNSWQWDGTSGDGRKLADGAYNVAVTGAGATVPFQAVGTVTGAEQIDQSVQLRFGAAGVTFDKVVSLGASGA